MKTKLNKLTIATACVLAIRFLLSVINVLPYVKFYFSFAGGIDNIILQIVDLAGLLSVGALAVCVFLRKRSWHIPILLLVPHVYNIISRLTNFFVTFDFEGMLYFLFFNLIIPVATAAFAYLLIFNPNDRWKKLWFLPAAVSFVSTILTYSINGIWGYFTFYNFISLLLGVAAPLLLFLWLAYPKGKAKTVRYTPAPTKSNASGAMYVPMVTHILLLLFTCGVYMYIWYYKTTQRLNAVYNGPKRNETAELLLCMFIPLYVIFWTYKTAQILNEVGKDKIYLDDFPTVCLLLSIFSIGTTPILIQEKINAMAKVFEKMEQEQQTQNAINTNATPETLLERAQMLLMEGQFEQADELANICLTIQPQNGEAYVCKLLAKYHLYDLNGFYNFNYRLDQEPLLNSIISFASEERKQHLLAIVAFVNTNMAYTNAVALFDAADTVCEYRRAKEAFEGFVEFKDSRDYIEKCDQQIAGSVSDNKDAQKKLTVKIAAIIGVAIVALSIIFAVVSHIEAAIAKKNNYAQANALLEQGEYEEASEMFKKLDTYKDSVALAEKSDRLQDMYEDFLSDAKRDLLTVDFTKYSELNQELPLLKNAKEIQAKYAAFSEMTYGDNGSAKMKVSYYESSEKTNVKFDISFNTKIEVGEDSFYPSSFSQTVEADQVLTQSPLVMEKHSSGGYYYKYTTDQKITISKNELTYVYSYVSKSEETNYTVTAYPAK